MDFEEELELFFIRKETIVNPITEPTAQTKLVNNNNFKHTNDRDKNVFKYIPLMLKHLKALNENSWIDGTNVIKIFKDKVLFKHCLVYGTLVGRRKETKSSFIYLLDDGTECMKISLFRRTNDMETVWKLENELDTVRRTMLAQNKNEIVKSLRNLLNKTKQQMDPSSLKAGSKVLLYGRPTYFHEEVCLNVYSFIDDTQINRDIEIAFKDYLIDWYRNNCLLTKST